MGSLDREENTVKKIAVVFALVLTVLVSAPLAGGQKGKVRRIGVFHVGHDHVPPSVPALRAGLKALGYVEGKNFLFDLRNLADEAAARITAREFVRKRYDVIVAIGEQTVRAAKAATSEVPVVFLLGADPVAGGFVKSLSHPGGNMTGFFSRPVQIAKQIELFREVVPGLRRPLVLIDPTDPVTQRELAQIRKTASALNLRLVERMVTTRADIERVFRSLKVKEVDGVIVPSHTLRTNHPSLVLRLASDRELPLASHLKKWVKRGGLFSYSADLVPIGRAAATTVDKILKGAKPTDIPVERPRKFNLVINLKTAEALGVTIPPEVLLRATKVIR